MIPILVFDIETIPDVVGLRKVWNLSDEVSDQGVVDLVAQRRRQATGSDFLPAHVQRVVAISCVLRSGDEDVRAWSLGALEDDERSVVARFFDGIERYKPQLVSWNGSTFDLPVLQYRAMIHAVPGCCYWDQGDSDREFKFNNYLSRFHTRHTDLMDVLGSFNNRAWAPLDDMARLCGFPGKLGMDGSQVYDAVKRGELASVRAYCETDVANTYLLYLRYQLIRGSLDAAGYEREIALFRAWIAAQPQKHWQEFLAAWK
jgi:predicted PolB exonuclease-like 3'-5' exonuclease